MRTEAVSAVYSHVFIQKKFTSALPLPTLRFSRFLISSLISEMEGYQDPSGPSSPLKRLLTEYDAVLFLFGADYQHIGDLLQLTCLTDLVADLLSLGVDLGTDTGLFQLSKKLSRPYSMYLSVIGSTRTCYRIQPGRECACEKMLDQNTDGNARWNRIQTRLNHDRTMFLAVCCDVLQFKALRQLDSQAEWYRTARFFPTNPPDGSRSSVRRMRRRPR